MYSIPIVGAVAVDLDGTPIGIIHAIEHGPEGVSVYVFTGEESDDPVKENVPQPETLARLRAVAGQKVNE